MTIASKSGHQSMRAFSRASTIEKTTMAAATIAAFAFVGLVLFGLV